MNLQKLLSDERCAVKKEVIQERKTVTKLLNAVSGDYEFMTMEVMQVTERVTFRTAILVKEQQLRTAPSYVRTAVSEVMNFKPGTELIFAWEVDDRVERGFKPLYTFVLPTGSRFPLYPEEFVWSDDKTEEYTYEIPITHAKDRTFLSVNLGNKKDNQERYDFLGDEISNILTEEEITLIGKYFNERNTDEYKVIEYDEILRKISKASRKLKREQEDEQ